VVEPDLRLHGQNLGNHGTNMIRTARIVSDERRESMVQMMYKSSFRTLQVLLDVLLHSLGIGGRLHGGLLRSWASNLMKIPGIDPTEGQNPSRGRLDRGDHISVLTSVEP